MEMEEFQIVKHLGQLTADHENKTLKTICTMPDPSGVYLKTDICFSINMWVYACQGEIY